MTSTNQGGAAPATARTDTDMTIRFSDAIDKLAPALVEAQSIMDAVPLDSKNPAFRSKYASLTACLYAVQPALRTAKLMLTQHPSYDAEDKVVSVTTMLMHSSGQFMSSTCSLPLGGKKDGHALKSATTYLRRIGIIGILGLPEDDDSWPDRVRAQLLHDCSEGGTLEVVCRGILDDIDAVGTIGDGVPATRP